MNNKGNNIFVKKSEIPYVYDKVELSVVLETIPQGSFKERQVIQAATKTEMRWRFLKIPVSDNEIKTIVEISRKSPDDKPREYLNKQMEWVTRDIDPKFDTYVVDTYYCYTST